MKISPVLAGLLLAAPVFAASGSRMALDGQGNIWRTGQNLPVALTANAFQKSQVENLCATQQLSPFQPPTFLDCSHAYVTKQDSSGNVLYATYLGGSSEDGGIAITTDAQGNAYVTGFTYSADFPVTAGVAQPHNAGPHTPAVVTDLGAPFGPVTILPGGDLFVAKFAPDGTLLYSTLLGGSGSDLPALIGVDASGSVYVAGTTLSTDFPVTSNGLNHQLQIGSFFARLNPQATALEYSTYSDPTILSFDVDGQGDAFLTGAFEPAGASGPYVTEIDTASGRVLYSAYLPNLNAKYAGRGAAVAAISAGEAWVGVSPAPAGTPSSPVSPLGASFLLKLSTGGGNIAVETDIGNSQFDSISLDSAGNAYALGHGTGALPAAASPPLLAAPCSSAGGAFVVEVNGAGGVVAATYLRQGSGAVAVVQAPGQLSVYRAVSQTMVAVDLAGKPAMNFGCALNLASGEVGPGLAPGEIFAIFGSNLGPAQPAAGVPDASGQYPTTLAGVQVLINGAAVPLIMVQAGEIHGVVSFGWSQPVETVQVRYLDQSAPVLDAPVSEFGANPGIFVINGQGAILNQDETVNTPANPAKLGSIVSIYATGTGALATPIDDGAITPIPPPFIVLASPPQVTFAGVPGEVLWAGSAPGLIAGVTQINVQLPSDLPNHPVGTGLAAIPVVLSLPGVLSPSAAISLSR